jgi:hypothetical protein
MRESEKRVSEGEADALVAVVDRWASLLELPFGSASAARRLLGVLLLGACGEGKPDDGARVTQLGEMARGELRRAFSLPALPLPAVPAVTGEDPGPVGALDGDDALDDGDAGEVEPTGGKRPPAEPAHEDAAEPLELVELVAVPADFRGRFALGDEGAERARRAYSERLRDEARRQADVDAAAVEADKVSAAEAAAARAARRVDLGPAPRGWDGGRRGRGPSGRRAG